jgi:CTP synthase
MEHNVRDLAPQADHILNIYDVSNIWHVPLLLRDQKGHIAIFNKLNLSSVPPPALESWATRAARCDNLSVPVKIAMVGKYTGLSDSYLSVLKALQHASIACSRKLVPEWVAATDLEERAKIERPDEHKAAWTTLKVKSSYLRLVMPV